MAPEGQAPDAAVLSPGRSPGSHAAPGGRGEGQALAVTGGRLVSYGQKGRKLNFVLSGAWSPLLALRSAGRFVWLIMTGLRPTPEGPGGRCLSLGHP